MKFPIKFLAIILAAILLYGCDSNQYQVVTGPDGALYRFNKKTGALSMMRETGPVSTAKPLRSEIMKERPGSAYEKPIRWKESKYPGKDLWGKFEMVWREGKLCYKFSVYPYRPLEKIFTGKKQDYIYSLMRPGFTVELVDKNGFLVKELKINLWSMAKVDGDGGAAKELVINSQIDCTMQSYGSIGGCTIRWALEDEMIGPDSVGDYIKSSPSISER